jgi:hypothetical protein
VDTDISAIDDLISLSRKSKEYVQAHLGTSEGGGRWGLQKVVSLASDDGQCANILGNTMPKGPWSKSFEAE